MTLNIENWERRRNYRLFDNSVTVPAEDSAKLDKCLAETPIQVGLPVVLLKLENSPTLFTQRTQQRPNANWAVV